MLVYTYTCCGCQNTIIRFTPTSNNWVKRLRCGLCQRLRINISSKKWRGNNKEAVKRIHNTAENRGKRQTLSRKRNDRTREAAHHAWERWGKEDSVWLLEHANIMTDMELATRFSRSVASIAMKLCRLRKAAAGREA